MSVIVWDGKTLAADRQGTQCDMRIQVSKMRRLRNGTLLAWTGSQETGIAMAHWYEGGADRDKLPPSQNKDDWSRLVVVLPNRQVVTYEQYGYPFDVLDCPAAWGSGRDFALGAIAMGADARKAVEIASQFSVVCGFGVEAIDIASQKTGSLMFDAGSASRTAAAMRKSRRKPMRKPNPRIGSKPATTKKRKK